MWIGIIILIIAFVFTGIVITNQENRDKKEGIILTINGQYLGGFNDIEGGKHNTCVLYKDQLKIYFNPQNYKVINLSNINNIGIKSDIQIQNDITLGRLLTVGVLAFGLKKKKTLVNNYVIINYDNNENIVLEMDNNEQLVREVNKLI
jgi:hypothetical protein